MAGSRGGAPRLAWSVRIDTLRGVAIALVLFHHFNIAYRLNDTSLAKFVGWDAVRAVARNGTWLSYELYPFHIVVLGAMRTACRPASTSGDVKLLPCGYLAASALVSWLIATRFAGPLNRRIRDVIAVGRWSPAGVVDTRAR